MRPDTAKVAAKGRRPAKERLNMATKNTRKLTDLEVRRAAAGKHGDTDGLWLYVAKRQDGQLGRKWIYKFRSPVSGKDREMGLGTFPAVSRKTPAMPVTRRASWCAAAQIRWTNATPSAQSAWRWRWR